MMLFPSERSLHIPLRLMEVVDSSGRSVNVPVLDENGKHESWPTWG